VDFVYLTEERPERELEELHVHLAARFNGSWDGNEAGPVRVRPRDAVRLAAVGQARALAFSASNSAWSMVPASSSFLASAICADGLPEVPARSRM
jgi:hypothetical protein